MFRTLIALLAMLAAACAYAKDGRPVTFEDLEGVKTGEPFVGATLDLSADGKFIAAEYNRQLKIFAAKSGKAVHDLGEGVLPLFSPSGDKLAFYSVRSGTMQLWLWNAKDDTTRQLTSFPQGMDPDPTTRISGYLLDAYHAAWSPDGSTLVFASRVAYPVPPLKAGEPLVLDKTSPSDLVLSGIFTEPGVSQGGVMTSSDGRKFGARAVKPTERLVNRLFAIDLASNRVEQLPGAPGQLFHPEFSPDGKRLAYAAIPENENVMTTKTGEIRLLDRDTRRETVLAGGAELKYRPRWSPNGAQLVYRVGAFGIQTEFHVVRVSDGQTLHQYVFDIQVSKYEWTAGGDGLTVSYYPYKNTRFGRVNLATGALQPLYDGVGQWWAQAADGKLVWIDGPAGPDVFVLRKGARAPVNLFSLHPPEKIQALRLGHAETIAYRTARGFNLKGKLLLPPDYVPGKKYPLIVDPYPLTSASSWMHPMYGNEAWAAAGYAVFKPNQARAPHVWVNCAGEKSYCAASKGPDAWDVMVDDVMSGVDELIRRGLVDPQRMCAYGHSNGGGVVDYLITQTNRFKCAIIVAPVWPDWIGPPLLDGWWGTTAQWTGVSPLDDPEAYIKLSAVFQVKNVNTPVLLVVGDKDTPFLLGAVEMFNALRMADKDVTFLRYPGQGHVFVGDGLRNLWAREMAFFGKYLTPQTAASAAHP